MIQQFGRRAGILTQYHIYLLQHFQRAERYVFEVTEGGGDEVEQELKNYELKITN